jgi:hypothetical protein
MVFPLKVAMVQMKFFPSIFALALLPFFNAAAQVTVEATLDQEQFLPSEAIPITVHVTNRSGQALHLGADADWLTFSVESADGFVIVKRAEVPVQGEFDLGSSEVATKRVNLTPYFGLSRPGLYRVIATLHIKDWDRDVTSAAKSFDVIKGATIWSQDFGLPTDGNNPPEARRYTLEKANYLRSQLRLYVQVSDLSETHVFKVSAIGPMVSFSQPDSQLDRFSNLHVLYQSSSAAFTYTVVTPNGEIARQEVYDYLDTHPRLGADADGNIVVIGGARRVKPEELPAVKSPGEMPAPTKP